MKLRYIPVLALLLVMASTCLSFSAQGAAPCESRPLTTKSAAPLSLKVTATKTKSTLTFGELVDRLLEADVVCVGEQHDSELHHRVQLQIIKALYAQDESLAVGMEMFQKPFQQSLDRFLAGRIGEKRFLKQSEYTKRWGFDWKLYKPIVDFCKRNQIPVAALNASAELTKQISKVGFAGLTGDEKKELGPIDFNVKAHRDYWYEALSQMHGQHKATPEQKERSYQVMTVWDDYMAQTAASFKKSSQVRRLVVLAGDGHIEHGFGIPNRTAGYAGAKVVTVGVVIQQPDEEIDTPDFDYVIYVQVAKGAKAGSAGK